MINNSISHVWGGDREVMTYDNAGGAYFGPLASVSSQSDVDIVAAGPRIPLNRFKANSSTTGGGWVVEGGALIVLNGTGAGQIRRIVASTSSTGWTLDAPLDPVTLSGNAEGIEPSFVQMLPFRGRNLFHQNHFADVGAFQFYGIGLGNIVAENKNERMAGMVSWGQWREWHGPTSMMPRLGGEMGCGANPNMRNVFEGNVFAEGNTIVNYNTPQGASDNFLAGYLLASTSGGGAGNATGAGFEHLSMNSLTVFRDNTIKSNGGILITDDSMDIVVEGNTVMNSDLNICVTNTTRNVVVRNNNASVSANC